MDNENQYNNYLRRVKVPYLDRYYTKEETEGLLADKQNTLIAGVGIEISNTNTISVSSSAITEIDDTVIETGKTWSSSKISGELEGKSNTGHTHDQYSLTGHTHEQYSLTSHTHTAQDIGALPSSTTIPSATSQLTNDSGFITGFTETDPTVPAWAKAENKPTYDVREISGLTEELACKSDTGHTHEQYSLTSHTHTISDTSDLRDALDSKSNTGHTHQMSEVSGLTEIVAEIDGKQGILSPGSHILISANNEIDTTGVVASQYIANIWRGTQVEYDALSSYDNNTLYVITQ